MVSERDAAKGAATNPEEGDPELEGALIAASKAKVELLREQNRHAEAIAKGERGWFGGVFGGKDHAPTFIAFSAMFLGFIAFGWAIFQMANADEPARAFWWDVAQYVLTFTGTALGFAVGNSSK